MISYNITTNQTVINAGPLRLENIINLHYVQTIFCHSAVAESPNNSNRKP